MRWCLQGVDISDIDGADMKVLVVGTGGREHALAWRIAFSPGVEVLITRGNPGTEKVARSVAASPHELEKIVAIAKQQNVDFVVVGPEAPLAAGLVDSLEAEGIKAFGPKASAARIESSKAFAHEVMEAACVPCARATVFDDAKAALRFIESHHGPIVVKADGLAAGKGVTVARTRAEARAAVESLMVRGELGDAGKKVVLEEYLEGVEASYMALCDGDFVRSLAPSQDHKRLLDNDEGPNTGGMGAYSPTPFVDKDCENFVVERILKPTLGELLKRGIVYRGVLYAGLMITRDGPKVLEFNCRFGDPEAQVVLYRWQGDFLEALLAVTEGRLAEVEPAFQEGAAICVVLAAQGYPAKPRTGDVIEGLEEAERLPGCTIFHAGTAWGSGGMVVTASGRVLGVTAYGSTLIEARQRVYEAVSKIRWPGIHFRKDIGAKALLLSAGSSTP